MLPIALHSCLVQLNCQECLQSFGVTPEEASSMRTSALASRVQSKIYSSESIARRTLSKFVTLDGGWLPVSDFRRALNMMCADCVPVSHFGCPAHCVHVCSQMRAALVRKGQLAILCSPHLRFPLVEALQHTVHRLFASMVQSMIRLAGSVLVQDDKAMATLLCAFDPSGQGTLTYPSFLKNVLNSFVAHARMNPAHAADNGVTLPPMKDHFLGIQASEDKGPRVHARSHGEHTDTRIDAHAFFLRPVLSSLARCRICPVADQRSSPAEQLVLPIWYYAVQTSCLFCPCLAQSHLSGVETSGLSVSITYVCTGHVSKGHKPLWVLEGHQEVA